MKTALNLLSATVASLVLNASAVAADVGKLKRITILETNNFVERSVVSNRQDQDSDAVALKDYVLGKAKFKGFAEPQIFTEAMDWVASQWKHDGFNAAPDSMSSLEILKKVHNDGQRYRCVEYGRVLADFLAAMGHESRAIGMMSVDVAYGGWGRGHVATEVWSNELGKWIFLDPQFSIYATHAGELLNFYDMSLLKRQGKFEEIQFHVTPRYAAAGGLDAKARLEYASFLKNYFGYLSVPAPIGGKRENIVLPLEGEQPALTFQGTPRGDFLYTLDVGLAYPRLNSTRMRFAFDGQTVDPNEVMKKYEITTEDAYIANMWRWAPEGKFKVSLSGDMIDLDHYEISKENGEWASLTSNTAAWSLTEGVNILKARSVSKRGIKGPASYIKVLYQ